MVELLIDRAVIKPQLLADLFCLESVAAADDGAYGAFRPVGICVVLPTSSPLITKPSFLAELAALVQSEFAQMDVGSDTYVSIINSINASKKGNYVFHYNAPVLIVTANKKNYGNALADSACALENIMIAANALDLGACWINRLHCLTDHEAV